MPFDFGIKREADFSDDLVYRYSLKRTWIQNGPKLVIVMLNPSKANHKHDDPTTTFMIGWADRNGFGKYEAVNLFALVDTYPKGLYLHENPIGERNDEAIKNGAESSDRLIVAWGNHGELFNRGDKVIQLLKGYELWCFGTTNQGHPKFPRALRREQPIQLF